MKTMVQHELDLKPWEDRRVPRKVLRVMLFIHRYRERFHTGPPWSDIAAIMGWSIEDRASWRREMKRLRRWGVKWRLNEPGSTKIDSRLRPFLDAIPEDKHK